MLSLSNLLPIVVNLYRLHYVKKQMREKNKANAGIARGKSEVSRDKS